MPDLQAMDKRTKTNLMRGRGTDDSSPADQDELDCIRNQWQNQRVKRADDAKTTTTSTAVSSTEEEEETTAEETTKTTTTTTTTRTTSQKKTTKEAPFVDYTDFAPQKTKGHDFDEETTTMEPEVEPTKKTKKPKLPAPPKPTKKPDAKGDKTTAEARTMLISE
ncbi:hypothetical protein COOONC_22402 [Cooperia oncophora]